MAEAVSSTPVISPATVPASARETLLLWLLAGFQFKHILDFMIITPLAPQFMRLWRISAQQFGYLVSVYAIAAAAAGLAAAFVIDKFDRRSALLAMYAGFVVATPQEHICQGDFLQPKPRKSTSRSDKNCRLVVPAAKPEFFLTKSAIIARSRSALTFESVAAITDSIRA